MIAGPPPLRALLDSVEPPTDGRAPLTESKAVTDNDRGTDPCTRAGASSTLVVAPTYNERENVEALGQRLFRIAPEVDLVVVDDDSPDGTADLCRKLAGRWPRLFLLQREGPRALGKAYVAGLRYGLERGYSVIGTMDADLSHSPEYLPRLLAAIESGAEVAMGSRYVPDGGTINWGLGRMLLSRAANRFSALLLGIPARDVTSGFRLYRASVLQGIGLERIRSTGYSFLVELLYRAHLAGARLAEVPIVFHDRRMGRSKLRSREIYLGAWRLLGLRMVSFHGDRVASRNPRPRETRSALPRATPVPESSSRGRSFGTPPAEPEIVEK